jgi:hypothetical protein
MPAAFDRLHGRLDFKAPMDIGMLTYRAARQTQGHMVESRQAPRLAATINTKSGRREVTLSAATPWLDIMEHASEVVIDRQGSANPLPRGRATARNPLQALWSSGSR